MKTYTVQVNKNCGRPRLDWDNQKWLRYFSSLKQVVPRIPPSDARRLPLSTIHLSPGEEYKGDTAYQSYCSYINDVLSSIRSGQIDYCYFIYQIADLLQFEPGLQTRLCCEDRLCPYFEVWLESAEEEETI